MPSLFFEQKIPHSTIDLHKGTPQSLHDLFTLSVRGYSKRKLEENIECEIMMVVLQEARESYKPEIVRELQSNTIQDMEANLEAISAVIARGSL